MIKGQKGYVRLYRDIMDWSWYDDANTVRLFIHCILKANYDDNVWHGIKIERGSFVTSYAKLAQELKLTKRQIQTALKNLKMTQTVLHKPTAKYSVITVKNYTFYQSDVTQNVTQVLHRCSTDVTQMLTTNKRNKGKKDEFKNRSEIFKKLREDYEKGELL